MLIESRYLHGLRTMIVAVSVGIVFAALQMFIYHRHNKSLSSSRDPKDGKESVVYIL